MGCQCCRMIKSYIYDPSAAVDVRKSDSAGSSLYQPHQLSGGAHGGNLRSSHNKQKEGFHNPGYSKSNDSTLKLEVDNNHVNHRLHSTTSMKEPHRQGSTPPTEVYIIQPEGLGQRWMGQEKAPSQVPVYPNIQEYEKQKNKKEKKEEKKKKRKSKDEWDSIIDECVIGMAIDEVYEIDEGVGVVLDLMCDTGDEGSVLSVDIHTSTTTLSSAETRDGRRQPKTPDVSTVESGISVMKSEDEDEKRNEEVQSVTDSMVAEALAALEAATAGEDCE
ncbi:uncharacterized protein zgc:194930 [Dicentrarchus labrax]|uniref:Uncharacterized protein n=1 Tax=Dicentrarchus labrax TaxID=13489 RepID=A0A8P4GQ90_DICLA|nr:uncharacterized protein zgc:194930 [Dicentrarchus labrax]